MKSKKIIKRNSPLNDVWINRKQQTFDTEDRGNGIYIPGNKHQLIHELTTAINNASEMICVSSFIIQETEVTRALLDEAANYGIRIYLLTASETYLKKDYSELSEYSKDIVDKHKDLLDSLSGNVLVRTADHLHSKFLLVDPHGKNPVGFLLTSNLTEKAMTENLEVCIKLNPSQIRDLYIQFTQGFWIEAKQELMHSELRPAGNSPYSDFPQPDQIVWTLGQDLRLKSTILDLIKNAKKDILISSWGLEADHVTREAIEQKVKDGLKVTILTKPNARNTAAISDLARSGAKVLGHEHMHAKVIISDNQKGLVMTSNFSHKGLDEGFETGLSLNPKQLATLKNLFDDWTVHASWDFTPECGVEKLEGEVQLIEGERLRKKKVKDRTSVDLGVVKIKDEKDSAKDPDDLPWPNEIDEVYKEVEFIWEIKIS